MIQRDKRPPGEIEAVIRHIFNERDSWWAKTGNIQTPLKFRRRNKDGILYYDMMLREMKINNKKKDDEIPEIWTPGYEKPKQ